MCEILFVCPVQFVFTELQSGSTLLLGVHSIPKSCENSVDPPAWGTGSESKKTSAGKLSQNAKGRCDAEGRGERERGRQGEWRGDDCYHLALKT